jgi:hypothetical protein
MKAGNIFMNMFLPLSAAALMLCSCGGGSSSSEKPDDEPNISDETEAEETFPADWDSEKLPILAWDGIPAKLASNTTYSDIRNAYISYNLHWYSSADELKQVCKIGKDNGVGVFGWYNGLTEKILESEEEAKKAIDEIKDTEGLAYYNIADEPNAADFDKLATIVERVQKYDEKHPCYINLFPEYASEEQLGTSSYQEYLDEFIEKVPIPMLSFDYYPITNEGEGGKTIIRTTWFKNLEMARAASLKSGRPMWAFACIAKHLVYVRPEARFIRLQVYCDLAYGAKVIEYYSYYPSVTGYEYTPVDADGSKTSYYYNLQSINKELQNRARVFVGTKVTGVWHIGSSLPMGTTEISDSDLPLGVESVNTDGSDVVVSVLEKESAKYLMLVNASLSACKIQITFGRSVCQISETGGEKVIPASFSTSANCGEALIFKIS